jgi:hypothetical protein
VDSPVPARGPLIVADVSQTSLADQVLAASLQGLANQGPSSTSVFLITRASDWHWLDYCLRFLQANPGFAGTSLPGPSQGRPIRLVTVPELLQLLKPVVSGQVLYDPEAGFTLDLATTAAGIRQAVVSPTDLGLPTLLDLRGRWQSAREAYLWALDNLLGECAPRKAAVIPATTAAFRDFAIQQRIFTISPPAAADDASFRECLFRLSPGTALYGDVPYALDAAISSSGHYLIPATDMANLSYYSRLPSPPALHQYFGQLEAGAPRYLALIFDCSDIGFAANGLPSLWDDPARGTLALGWALPAAMAETAPLLLHYYYGDAYRSGTDQFILGTDGAGRLEISTAASPAPFFEATTRAQDALDAHTVLVYSATGSTEPSSGLPEFIAETGVQGVFLTGGADFEPTAVWGTPVIATPYCTTVAEAVQYLDRVPAERRSVALCLDARALTPGDAAHIAAYVGSRYVPVAPEDMIELIRTLPAAAPAGEAAVAISSVEYPQSPQPDTPLPVNAEVVAPEGVTDVSVIYQPPDSPLGFRTPTKAAGGKYRAELPPLLCGGDFRLRVRAVDSVGRVTLSPVWTMAIPRADTDSDGLSDAEERFLLTDPGNEDTDDDGLWDVGDRRPLSFDRVAYTYSGPIRPPSDLPYLVSDAGSQTSDEERAIAPGQSCVYWLPLGRLPPGAAAAVEIGAVGPARVSFGASLSAPAAAAGLSGTLAAGASEQFTGDIAGFWRSEPLRSAAYPSGVLISLACPASATEALRVRSLAIVSAADSPSIAEASVHPPHPGPAEPITMSATAFSPDGIKEVVVSYRINDGGTIGFPMQQVPGTQRYLARLPACENRDVVQWWLTATDKAGKRAATPLSWLPVGTRPRETVSLVTTRDLTGDWSDASDWLGATRAAFADGLVDSGSANLTGGTYAVWVLGGGRGKGIGVYVGDQRVGSVGADLPDRWQSVGRVRLEAGRHRVSVVSEPAAGGPELAAPRYACVVLTADPSYLPPGEEAVDYYNCLTCLSPLPGDTLTGTVEVQATGAGNLAAVEFSLDGSLLRRVSGPPFSFSLATARFTNGAHTLRLQGMDRAGPTGLSLDIPVTIAN